MTPTPADAPARRRPAGRYALRVLRGVVALMVVAFLGAWYVLETETAAERVREFVEARAAALTGQPVQFGRLELDVFPPTAELAGVRIGPEEEPRFIADRVRIEIGAVELLRSELSIENVELDRPQLDLTLLAGDGEREPLPSSPLDITIHRAAIVDGSIAIADARTGIAGEIFGVSLDLQPEGVGRLGLGTGRGSGRLSIDSGQLDLTARNGSAALLTPLELVVDFGTRSRVADLDRVQLNVSNSTIRAEGALRGLNSLDLQVEADLDLADLFTVWQPPGPDDHAGRAVFEGSLQFRSAGPVVAGRLRSDRARFAGLDLDDFIGDLQLRQGLVTLRNVRMGLYGGTLGGNLSVNSAAEPFSMEIDYDAADIDAAALTAWELLGNLRLAGRLSGAGTLGWSTPVAETISGAGSLALRVADVRRSLAGLQPGGGHTDPGGTHTIPSLPLPGEVQLGYRVADGRLSLQDASATLPGTSVDIDAEIDFDGALRGSMAFDSRDLRVVDHVAAQIRGLAQGAPVRRFGLRGTGNLTAVLGGTSSAPEILGTLTVASLALADLRIGDFDADLTTVNGMLRTSNLSLRSGSGGATGYAAIRLPARGMSRPDEAVDYDVQLQLDNVGSSFDLEFGGPEWSASSSFSGQLGLRGRFDQPWTATFDVEGRNANVGGTRFNSVSVRGRKAEELWLLEDLVLRRGSGELQASILYGLVDRELQLDATAADFDVADAVPWLGIDASLGGFGSGRISLAGPLEALSGDGELLWSASRANDVALGQIAAGMRADAGVVAIRLVAGPEDMPTPPRVSRTTVATAIPRPDPPQGGWSASAAVNTRAPYAMSTRLGADADVGRLLLAPLGIELPDDLRIDGRLDLEVQGRLQEVDSWSGSGSLRGLALERGGFRARADVVDARVSGSRVNLSGAIETPAGVLTVTPEIDLASTALDGEIRGELSTGFLKLIDPSMVTAGTIGIDLRLDGTTSRPRLGGAVQLRGIRLNDDWPYGLRIRAAELQFESDRVRIAEFEGSLGEQEIVATGDLAIDALTGASEAAESNLQVRIDRFALAPLLERAPAVQRLVNQGFLSGRIDVSGPGLDPRQWTGELELTDVEIRMQQYRTRLSHPVTAYIGDGRLSLSPTTRLAGGRTDFELSGTVDLNNADLDLRALGALGFEAFNVLSPYWGTGGVADVDMRIYGGTTDLAYQGSAELRDVVLSPPPLRQPIEDIAARLDFEDRRIRIRDVTGVLGGGAVTGGGEIFLRNNFPQSFRLAIDVDSAFIRLERDVRLAASASLVHDGTPERSLLTGTLDLEEAMYRRDYEADRALLDLLDRPETDADPFLQSINLALEVTGNENLFIDNNLADIEVVADFDIRGTAAEPVVLGRSSILSGRLFWNGSNFDVLQGTVEFNNPFETEPTFEVRARTEIRSYTVDMRFSGSLTQGVSFDYTSTPTLSDLELFNLLAFGEEPDSEIVQDRGRYQQALGLQATRYLTDAYFSEVESGAQRLFGVDRFHLSPTLSGKETDATARITLGKRINRNVYLTYSRLLSSSEDQLITVEYQLSPRIRIKGTRDEDGSIGFDFLVSQRIRR